MPVINSVAALKDEIAAYRQELHKNPQTAFEETFASEFVAQKLTEWGIPFKRGLGVTGIVATIEGKTNKSGKTIGLRGDMDALDIEEKTGLPHASQNPGKMHACGHDGHTATLLGTAKHLKDTGNFDGTVHLIFQPAEEGEGGAMKMIEDGLFKDFPCDYVFGIHNWPGLPIGHVATRVGPLLAATDEFIVTIKGQGGHAAMPHLTTDPAVIAAHIVTSLQTIVSRNVDPIDTAVISVCNMQSGTGAFNIIGDTAKLNGTVRTFSPETRKFVRERMDVLIKNMAKAFGAEVEMEYFGNIEPTVNTQDGVEMASRAASVIVGEENVDADCPPCMGGEDFGAFLQQAPGAFLFVGQATKDKNSPHNQGLHTSYYDFNDDIIPIGMSYFTTLVEQYMPADEKAA